MLIEEAVGRDYRILCVEVKLVDILGGASKYWQKNQQKCREQSYSRYLDFCFLCSKDDIHQWSQ